MSLFNREMIEKMDKRYRANFINSLTGFKSVCLVGTINSAGQTNLAIFSSAIHLGAHPPLIGLIVRPDSVERHTLSNIETSGNYTINHIHKDFYMSAHQTSARYPAEISEFDACNLIAEFKDNFPAPFVKESPLKIAMALREKIDLRINGTILLIGEIVQVDINSSMLSEDGYADIESLGSITCSGLDSYHQTQRLARLNYAKPGIPPSQI
jgi:flavin reductase (DIM6/NTAB) family NADH-FMN oxidoreductase RutF